MGSHYVIVECDENQHRDRPCECEQRRMIEIYQSLGGMRVLFIRYNPDGYKINGESQDTPERVRLDTLSRVLMEWSDRIPEHPLQVIYLYFDGCAMDIIPLPVL